MASIEIQRLPLDTSTTARLNAYNRHSLAPWLAEIGYLTPMYLHKREQERTPFNMARWMSPTVSKHMLRQPLAVFNLSRECIKTLLKIAAACDYEFSKAQNPEHMRHLDDLLDDLPPLPPCKSGHFIQLSESSPKDVDDDNLQAVQNATEALLKLVCSKRVVQAMLALYDIEDEKTDNKLYFFPYYSDLDRLSEWRCHIYEGNVVAISHSRFYQPYHDTVTDGALRDMVQQVRHLWHSMSTDLIFVSCALDVYAEIHKPDLAVKLIEINPYGPH